jgi:DNA modification methylase
MSSTDGNVSLHGQLKASMNEILVGDAVTRLKELPDESVNCCVTSPPYWGLRDYGVAGQLGLEATPQGYVSQMVEVFGQVRRVLRDDGTLWLNLGDSYASAVKGSGGPDSSSTLAGTPAGGNGQRFQSRTFDLSAIGLKQKDMVGIPWRVAFALQADGWYLRSDIIWAKPNPMPEGVTDRPTRSHEYIFLMSKSETYYYDANAIKEKSDYATPQGAKLTGGAYAPPGQGPHANARPDKQRGHSRRHDGFNDRWDLMSKEEQGANGRNKRSVWWIAPEPFPEAHFATFPQALVEPCILAGCPAGGVVLDPFMGSGTVALVALKAGRQYVGIELNPEYAKIAEARVWQEKNQARLA